MDNTRDQGAIEARLAALAPGLDLLAMPVCILDPQLRYRYLNAAYCAHAGRPAADFLGRHPDDAFTKLPTDARRTHLARAAGGRDGDLQPPEPRGPQRRQVGARALPAAARRRRGRRGARGAGGRAAAQGHRRGACPPAAATAARARQHRRADELHRPRLALPLRQPAGLRLAGGARPRSPSASTSRRSSTPRPCAIVGPELVAAFAGAEAQLRAPGHAWPTASGAGCACTSCPTSPPTARCGASTRSCSTSTTTTACARPSSRRRRSCAPSPRTFPARSRWSMREFRYVFVNKPFEAIRGNGAATSSAEACPRCSAPRPSRDLLRARSSSALRRGEPCSYERLLGPPGGEARWHLVRLAPITGADDGFDGFYMVASDIHDIKLAQQRMAAQEAQLRLFTDNIPDSVAYLDRDRAHPLRQPALRAAARHDARGDHRPHHLGACWAPRPRRGSAAARRRCSTAARPPPTSACSRCRTARSASCT